MAYNLINITYILLVLNPNNIVFIISSITNFILFITSLKILGEPLVNPRYSVNENESPQILQIYKKLSVFITYENSSLAAASRISSMDYN